MNEASTVRLLADLRGFLRKKGFHDQVKAMLFIEQDKAVTSMVYLKNVVWTLATIVPGKCYAQVTELSDFRAL